MDVIHEDKKSVKRKRTVVIILLMLICFLLGVMAECFHAAKSGQEHGGVEFHTGLGGSKQDDVSQPTKGVTISGMTQMYFPAGETKVSAKLVNPEENSGLYYLTFELRVKTDGAYETLYTSDLVAPGEQAEQITLSHPLEKGEYSAVLHIQPYHIGNELSPTNNADIPIKIIVG